MHKPVEIFDNREPVLFSTLESARPAIVDESREHRYVYRDFPTDGIFASACGRLLLFKWAGGLSAPDALCIVDTYFNNRILLIGDEEAGKPLNVSQIRKIVGFYDGDRCIVLRNNRLIWLQLDILNGMAVELFEQSLKYYDNVFEIDGCGRQFLVSNDEEIAIWELEAEILERAESRQLWSRKQPKSRKVVKHGLLAAQLSKNGDKVWIVTNSAIWSLRLSDMRFHRFPMPMANRVTDIRLIDGEYLIGLSNGPTLPYWQLGTRLTLYRLGEEVSLMGAFSLSPYDKWHWATGIIDDRSAIRIQLERKIVAHVQARRPESLLVTAHLAAMKAKKQFELPNILPISPLTGQKPKYGLSKRRKIG